MAYLLKTEPGVYSFADLQRERETVWDGVTNPAAVKHLREVRGVAVAPARDRDTRELDARCGGAECHVIRVVRRQPRVAQLAGDTQAPEDFHAARRDVVAFHARQLAAGTLFGNDGVDAAPGEVDGERGADRPAANYQHRRAKLPHQARQTTFTRACWPARTAEAARFNAAGRSDGCSTRSP